MSHAQRRRPSREKSREGGLSSPTTVKQSNSHERRRRPSRAQRPGQAQRRGITPPATIQQYAHAQRKVKLSGQTARSGEKNTTRTHAEEDRAERSGHAKRRGVWGIPSSAAIYLANTPKKAKPSIRASLCAAEEGVRGVLFLQGFRR